MIIGTLKKLRLSKSRKNNSNKKLQPTFPLPPAVNIHLTLPSSTTAAHSPHNQTSILNTKSNKQYTSFKMASSRTTTTSSSSTEFTNGYHTPTSPESFTDHHNHNHEHVSSASRQEYARILYEHTMKQMERFARDAQSRGTLSMDHYPLQHSAAASN
ncbi:hypothetical protein AA313_de0200428 [Arthrobotrys entomopaga]|nr:hypothetical protein AA313_de0200428 [Arthrobotrys entomopaga]